MTPLLLLTVTLAAPVPKGPDKVEAKFDGVWVLKSMEYRGGERLPSATLMESYTLVVVGNDYIFKTHGGTIKFDKEKKTVELNVAAGTYKGETSGGVFERDGDTLKLAIPSIPRTTTARPTELKTGANTTHYLYTFERNKDATAEKAAEQLKARTAALPNRANPFALPGGVAAPGGVVAPGGRIAPAAQLQEALERIEKLEKRIEELEKAAKAKKDK